MKNILHENSINTSKTASLFTGITRSMLKLHWIALLISIFFVIAYVGLVLSLPPIYLLPKVYPNFWARVGFYFHAYPGSIWLILGALQFFASIRAKNPKAHRIMGRIGLICLFISTIGGLIICGTGETEGGISLVLSGYFIFPQWILCGYKGWYYIKKERNITLHREWMTRAYCWSYSIIAMRPGVLIVLAYKYRVLGERMTNGQALAYVAPLFLFAGMILTEIYIRAARAKTALASSEKNVKNVNKSE